MSDFNDQASELVTVYGDNEPNTLENLLVLATSHPNASAEVLSLAATSQSAFVRSKVAENENTPCEILDELMHDCTTVRAGIARSSRAVERVWALVTDSSPRVRLTLAKNSQLPDHVYEALAHDPDPQVARQARRTLSALRTANNPVVSLIHMIRKAS